MKEDIHHLLAKYHKNNCTDEERRMVEVWFEEIGALKEGVLLSDERVDILLEEMKRSPRFDREYDADTPTLLHTGNKGIRAIAKWASVAASLLVFFGVTMYLKKNEVQPADPLILADIAPGGNQAYLTLSDGTRLGLTDSVSGRVAQQLDIEIINEGTGTLVYNMDARHTETNTGEENQYNTIEIPRGGQYQVVLPDGSRVWLNSSSSISFPVRFSSSERRVKVTGEAYFDVATRYQPGGSLERVPFLVETGERTIEVLGTEFNINDYRPGQTEVTLVTGKVRIAAENGDDFVMFPGQQALIGHKTSVIHGDMERVLAWKNGDFIFKNEKLAQILMEVSRWYDIDVECPPHLASLEFSGMVSRKQPLSSIVTMIESTGMIKVTRKERRLILIE